MKKLCLVLFLAVLLTGCGGLGPKLPEMENEKTALIYGYIDMEDAPSYLNWIQYKQYRPETDKPFFYLRITGSLGSGYVFYREVPAKGSYQLTSFGGDKNSFFRAADIYRYSFPAGKNATAVKTKGSGLYFMGAYKYTEVKTGFFEQDKFDIVKAKVSKKEILAKILPNAAKTKWEGMIEREIKRAK